MRRRSGVPRPERRTALRGPLATLLVSAALLALAGCANVPPYSKPAAGGAPPLPRPTPGAVVANPPAATPGPTSAAPDTTPSRDAQDVLATIADPLAPGERVPPPAVTRPATPDATGAAGTDSTAPDATADTVRADFPVPEPTPVLGQRPLPDVIAPADTTSAPAAPAPATLTRPAPTPGAGDTCWRVQLAAPAEKAKAERYLEAGRSQLQVTLLIEKEKGLFKVRTRDCVDGPAAESLRLRARGAGFDGAFRFRGKRP